MELHDQSVSGFFRHKDVFMHMTKFLSIVDLCSVRGACKSLNQWISDATQLAWQQRTRSAFPLSFETVLREPMKKQMQRINIFDSLIQAGCSVQYFDVVGALDFDQVILDPDNVVQLPWQKDIFLLAFHRTAALVNVTTASVLSSVDLQVYPTKILYDIAGQKVAFLSEEDSFIEVYKIEDRRLLVHERNVIHENFGLYFTFQQMYDDHVVFKNQSDEERHFIFHSIKTNQTVDTLTFESWMTDTYEALSQLTPVIYLCGQTEGEEYFVKEINCITRQITELHRDDLKVIEHHDLYGIGQFELIENESSKILKISQKGTGSSVEIFDVQEKEVIFEVLHETEDPYDDYQAIYQYGMENMQYNIDTRNYFSATELFESNQCILAVGNIDDTELDDNSLSGSDSDLVLPNQPIRWSQKFETYSACSDFHFGKWINNDIAMCTLNKQLFAQRRDPTHLFFFSVSQRKILGVIKEDRITQLGVISNDVSYALSSHGLYVIKFNTSGTNNKKRKLSNSTEEQNQPKKIKI